MIQTSWLTITFTYNGKIEKRVIDKMHIDYYDIKDFYRICGKKTNFDVYKVEGVWYNKLEPGLSPEVLELVGRAIDEAEK